MPATWKQLAYKDDVLPNLLSPYVVGDLLYASSTSALSKLAGVAVNQVLVSGGVGAAPTWSGTPTLAGITCTAINPLTTLAESWVGPSSVTGIYFKAGNVGIGTTNPLAPLEVNGVAGDAVNLDLRNNDEVLRFRHTGVDGYYRIYAYDLTSVEYRDIGIGGAEGHIYIKGVTGNVGIGTTNPDEPLHVRKNQATLMRLERSADADAQLNFLNSGGDTWTIGHDSSADTFTIAASDDNFATSAHFNILRTTGNIGIGTANPTAKLDVNGIVRSTGLGLGSWPVSSAGLEMVYTGDIGYLQSASRDAATAATYMPLRIRANGTYITDGNVGIGTTAPTNLLSLGGDAARIFWMERHTTANTAGNSLTVQAGGATVAATDKAGGQLILAPGLSTGSAECGVTIRGCVAGAPGTGNNSLQDMIKVLGNKLGFFNVTPVARATELTDELTSITHTAPGTPDYALQDLVESTGFGFATKDEGNSVLAVIANLQTRQNEMETKLTAYGLLIDAD
jgi:hypothetical protein